MNFETFKQRMNVWYQQCKAHDDLQVDRLLRWRNLEPESAEYLLQLIMQKNTKVVLELGTSNGFSTAWLAYALKQLKGYLTTIELDEIRTKSAEQTLIALNLSDVVDFVVSDVRPFLAHAQQNYQLIFLDAERSEYLHYVDDLKRLLKLTAGNILIVDNVISHASEVQLFLNLFINDTSFETQTLQIGAGLCVITYKGELSSI